MLLLQNSDISKNVLFVTGMCSNPIFYFNLYFFYFICEVLWTFYKYFKSLNEMC